MSEKVDPVMKLAQGRVSCVLPPGWEVLQQDDGDILICGPVGGLTTNPSRLECRNVSFAERLLCSLAMALLAQRSTT